MDAVTITHTYRVAYPSDKSSIHRHLSMVFQCIWWFLPLQMMVKPPIIWICSFGPPPPEKIFPWSYSPWISMDLRWGTWQKITGKSPVNHHKASQKSSVNDPCSIATRGCPSSYKLAAIILINYRYYITWYKPHWYFPLPSEPPDGLPEACVAGPRHLAHHVNLMSNWC